ncbi:hypothetical protein, partial [Campylobacter fetus]
EITKYPYLFWFLHRENVELNLNVKTVRKSDRIYQIKKINTKLFLFAKYLPIVLFFMYSFNIHDFDITKTNKAMELIIALLLSLVSFFSNTTIKIITSIAFFATAYYYFSSVPYIIKYFIAYLAIYSFINDTHKTVYSVLKNNTVAAHFYVVKE